MIRLRATARPQFGVPRWGMPAGFLVALQTAARSFLRAVSDVAGAWRDEASRHGGASPSNALRAAVPTRSIRPRGAGSRYVFPEHG